MKTEPELNYLEQQRQHAVEVLRAEADLMRAEFLQLGGDVETVKAITILISQRGWRLGEIIQRITGHEKLLPQEFEKFAIAMPEASLNFAKECLSIRRQNEAPPDNYEQAKLIFDRMMVQLDLLPKSERKDQNPRLNEPVADFITEAQRVATHSKTMPPPEQWEPFYRETFLRDTKPLADLISRVAQLHAEGLGRLA